MNDEHARFCGTQNVPAMIATGALEPTRGRGSLLVAPLGSPGCESSPYRTQESATRAPDQIQKIVMRSGEVGAL
jgi:hypothetical protein